VFTAGEKKQARRLTAVLALVSVFFVLEYAGATIADSVVLRADALHLLMDILALAMSLVAMRLAVRRPTARFTYGLRRAEPVAAIFNALLVLGATVEIVREGIENLQDNDTPRAGIMLIVASGALVVNGISAWLLHGAIHHAHGHGHGHHHHHDHKHEKAPATSKKMHGHSLNLRGAMLHLIGDTLGSIAALTAAIVIRSGGSAKIDAIMSFLVAAILVAGAIRLVRDAVTVLLEAAPLHLPVDQVRTVVSAVPGVADVHDLHVWTLGAGHDAITVHVVSNSIDTTLSSRVVAKVREVFEVEYVTVQVEVTEEPCAAPPSRFEEP
jgi:cation diffusion facilitator family transporter